MCSKPSISKKYFQKLDQRSVPLRGQAVQFFLTCVTDNWSITVADIEFLNILIARFLSTFFKFLAVLVTKFSLKHSTHYAQLGVEGLTV
ncbi:unnamed protein product [Didymodactylos carnosus]|uniref:Uncharacterized protein n=1 Tax=Didymodactylos carnosus TaxID=1234261 RepID=A0A815PBP0_9BILA|nr:unnamed protein product [Didymodactylos carnosus]CAF4321359.1 unnamed protein product [Didymodactylos carnosus]